MSSKNKRLATRFGRTSRIALLVLGSASVLAVAVLTAVDERSTIARLAMALGMGVVGVLVVGLTKGFFESGTANRSLGQKLDRLGRDVSNETARNARVQERIDNSIQRQGDDLVQLRAELGHGQRVIDYVRLGLQNQEGVFESLRSSIDHQRHTTQSLRDTLTQHVAEREQATDALAAKLDAVAATSATVDQRFDSGDQRLDELGQRLDAVDQRLTSVSEVLESLNDELRSSSGLLGTKFAALNKRVAAVERTGMVTATTSPMATLGGSSAERDPAEPKESRDDITTTDLVLEVVDAVESGRVPLEHISDDFPEDVTGLSGRKFRTLVAKLVESLGEKGSYMEIGTHHGKTICTSAALNPLVKHIGVDDFSLHKDRQDRFPQVKWGSTGFY